MKLFSDFGLRSGAEVIFTKVLSEQADMVKSVEKKLNEILSVQSVRAAVYRGAGAGGADIFNVSLHSPLFQPLLDQD